MLTIGHKKNTNGKVGEHLRLLKMYSVANMAKVFGMAKEKVIFVAKEKNNGKPELFIQPTMQKMLEQKIFYR